MSASPGTIYFTIDGETDPRTIGGGINPSAAVQVYSGPLSITGNLTVWARLRTASGAWSGLVEATFSTVTLAGDYDGSGTVDSGDYNFWVDAFGSAVQPGASADGNGDGIVDSADYTVWRDNLGASLLASAAGGGSLATVDANDVSADSITADRIEAEYTVDEGPFEGLVTPIVATQSRTLVLPSIRVATQGAIGPEQRTFHQRRTVLADPATIDRGYDELLVAADRALFASADRSNLARTEIVDLALDDVDLTKPSDDELLSLLADAAEEFAAL
jgi:hypothetical protein